MHKIKTDIFFCMTSYAIQHEESKHSLLTMINQDKSN